MPMILTKCNAPSHPAIRLTPFIVAFLVLLAAPCLAGPLENTREAAEQGDAKAQFNLGVRYANGQGVPRDDAEAVKWYRKAAEQGVAKAQFALGTMYANGQGVPRDYVAAYMWLSLAAAQGSEKARKELDHVESMITPEQRAEAQKLAREWRPKTQ